MQLGSHRRTRSVLLILSVLAASPAFVAPQQRNSRSTTPSAVPSGEELYARHCTVCHGIDLKGTGPVPTPYRTPPDLTTLSRRHGGRFPMGYVLRVLQNGPTLPAHAPAEMPVWGSEFASPDGSDISQVPARIRSLANYIKTRQQKQPRLKNEWRESRIRLARSPWAQ